MGGQIFPAYVLATAVTRFDTPPDPTVRGDPTGLIGVIATPGRPGQHFEVRVTAPDLIWESHLIATLETPGVEHSLYPPLRWRYDRLYANRHSRPQVVRVSVRIDGGPARERIVTAALRSLNDCPLLVASDGPDGGVIDLSWMIAAYVNEHHPWIDTFLEEARPHGPHGDLPGYRSDRVVEQVFAVWDALRRRGFRYSDRAPVFGTHAVSGQQVRFLDETVRLGRANCVDGSVLLASILARIGLGVTLAMTPDHCFLVFDLDPAATRQAGLETTLLDHERANDPNGFETALTAGTRQLEAAIDRFRDRSDPYYQLVDLDEIRRLGLRPLPYPHPAPPPPPAPSTGRPTPSDSPPKTGTAG